MKPVEIISDTEAYPGLEGHGRAASLPRLNAEYYVSSSLSRTLRLFCFLVFVLENIRRVRSQPLGSVCNYTPLQNKWQH